MSAKVVPQSEARDGSRCVSSLSLPQHTRRSEHPHLLPTHGLADHFIRMDRNTRLRMCHRSPPEFPMLTIFLPPTLRSIAEPTL